MMQSILQTTTKNPIPSSTKYSILRTPSPPTLQVTSLSRNNTSQLFSGSMFSRVVPTRKCASCG